MAESFYFSLVDKVLDKLGSFVYQEISSIRGVKNDLKKLEDTLSSVKAVLLDADEKQVESHQLRNWLQKLTDVCYDAEDVLDAFEIEALQRQAINHQSIGRKVCNFISCSNPLAFHFRMSHKINEVRNKFDEIATAQAKFHFTERNENRPVVNRGREMTHSFVLTSDVIGRDKDKEAIIKLLIDSSDGEIVSVVPIVGIGGVGKTALAKLVYNDERVDKHFEMKIWVCVSEDFGLKQLMVKIIKSATNGNCSKLDLDQLQTVLRQNLRERKYLLVLDDVWNHIPEKWIELKTLLNGGAYGSKIIVTTRSNRVASIMRHNGYKYSLKGLPYESCLPLFIKCAFKEGQEKHPNLIKIGEEIVKKCGGIPLAVRTLGSLLYASNDEHIWKYVKDNDIWNLEQKEYDILPALRLSYDQLPSYLKQCFVYCSIFPKDYEFKNVSLIQFWMAHGLLRSSHGNEELEDIGMRYLKELWSRSFFQDFVQEIDLVTFKMHDLIHDLALLIAKDECLILNSNSQIVSKNLRHLSFVGVNALGKDLSNLGQVRTIFFPIDGEGPSHSLIESCISRCQFLRVLDLSDSNIEVLPKNIGNLKHLRYLDLTRCREIKKLPNSICRLQSLQTLRLDGCQSLKELPRDIRYLRSLRMLVLTTKQKSLQETRIGCLNSLRFLAIGFCDNLEYLFEDIGHLKVLHTLIICHCPSLISLPRGIKYLSSLENLIITDCENLNLISGMDLEGEEIHPELSRRSLNLQKLGIGGLPQLVELPQWLLQGFAHTLQYLYIRNCPNFMALSESLQNVESLQILYIMDCPKVSSMPEEIRRFTVLRELIVKGCPELSKKCKVRTGKEWSRIAHIPTIWLDDELIKSSNY